MRNTQANQIPTKYKYKTKVFTSFYSPSKNIYLLYLYIKFWGKTQYFLIERNNRVSYTKKPSCIL